MKTYHDWIMTYTGRKIDPLNPDENNIDIIDIAHALSLKCRFSGHCKEFYSVAQHSVLVSEMSIHPLEGLMHDASEAYLPDVVRPLKQNLNGFKEIEDSLLEVIFKKYNLIFPIPKEVKNVDSRLCLTEGRDLMPDISEWELLTICNPYEVHVSGWSPEVAKHLFLSRFRYLVNL